jgi:hypothetical protein
MSFQAYLANIEAKTGQTPADFRRYAEWQGYVEDGRLKPDVKAGTVVADLKRDFNLGHGHAMAIFALLKGHKKEGDA